MLLIYAILAGSGILVAFVLWFSFYDAITTHHGRRAAISAVSGIAISLATAILAFKVFFPDSIDFL